MAIWALRILTGVVVLSLIGLLLYAGEPEETWWWLFAIPVSAWIIGPAVMPYFAARRWANRNWFVWTMLIFQVLSSGWVASVYYEAFFVSTSSTASLVLIFVPLYQWGALACAALLCLCAKLWLKRRRAKSPSSFDNKIHTAE